MERSEASWEYAADISLRTKALSHREAHFKSSDAVLPAIKKAAAAAPGIALSRGTPYDRYLTGYEEPSDEEGWYDVELSLTFTSDKSTWEESSGWLREALEGVTRPDVRVLRLSQFLGRFRA